MRGQILRHNVKTGREDAIVTGLASPVDVALDSHQIYWSDVGVGRTQRASLDGGDVQWLLNGSIATFSYTKCIKMCFIHCIHIVVRVCPVCPVMGHTLEILMSTTNCWETPPHSGGNLSSAKLCRFLNMSWLVMNTYGMAVDSDLGKLYMADFEKTGKFTGKSTDYTGRIRRANLDGSDAEVRFLTQDSRCFSMAIYCTCTSSILHDSTCRCVCLSMSTKCVWYFDVFCTYHVDRHKSHRSGYVWVANMKRLWTKSFVFTQPCCPRFVALFGWPWDIGNATTCTTSSGRPKINH